MKKLNKISKINEQTFEAIQAYACVCGYCQCYCTDASFKSSNFSNVGVGTTPTLHVGA